MSGIKYTNQIKMLTPPTEPEHVARKGDVEPVLLTEAALAALESPPDSGLYPTLKSKEVVTTDHSIDTVGIFPYPDFSSGQELFTETATSTNYQDEVTIPADGYIAYGTTVSVSPSSTVGNGSAFNALLDGVLLNRFDLGSLRAIDGGSVINAAFSLVGHAYVRAGQKFNFHTDITAASWSTIWSRYCTFYPLLFKKVLPNKVIVSPGSSYATTEIETADTWIDGKKIYRIVMTKGSFTITTDTWLEFGTVPSNVDTITNARWITRDNTGGVVQLNALVKISKSSNKASIYPLVVAGIAYGGSDLVLEYTKV